MSSNFETSFNHDDLDDKKYIENKIPRSPAVEAYESYAAWKKKKFPPRPLDYRAEDYTLPKTQTSDENHSNKKLHNAAFQKSSYFPNDGQNLSGNDSDRNPPDSMLPRSSYSPLDSENSTVPKNNYPKRRSFPYIEESNQRYNTNNFQQNSPHMVKNSSPGNKISQEAQQYIKKYSCSENLKTRISNPYTPTPQNSGNPRTGQKEFAHNYNYSRRSSSDYEHRSNQNAVVLQPVRYNSDHRHSYPSCPGEQKSRELESGEMVKGLLKLIDNQNEQIKNLQAQLDRLLTIHEETLKEKAKCMCSLEIPRQNPQICMQAYNAALHTKNSAIAAESFSNEPSNRRNVQFDDHSKKTLMERKVSIGVMTSFELTVQNSPFNLETEDQPVIENLQDEEIYRDGENNPSNMDLSKRKQNLFSMMPSPLENIIEDSESHLSSSQQQSSNCLSSCKNGNLQVQSGKSRTTSANNFNKSNSQNQSSNSNENSPNYSNKTRNRRESGGQNTEVKNQRNAECDFSKNTSPVTRTEPVIRETISNSRSATPRGFEESRTPTHSPDFTRREQIRMEEQNKKYKNEENIRNEDIFQEESLVLSGGRLEIKERNPPSPAPSIHVDMQEYSSEDGSMHTKRTPKVGWTFYNNVLGQVNHILQNSAKDEEDPRNRKEHERQEMDKNILIDTVKSATMDQLKKLGISFVDNEAKEAISNKKVTFDPSYYYPEMNMMQGTSIMTETNTSMHMKALAMKYLNEEQVCESIQQKQRRGALKNLMVSNVQGTTNMSFATMRYLQRYQLLPESMNGYMEDEGKENFEIPQISENQQPVMQKPRLNLQNRPSLPQTAKTNCPSKILDISTLKQQPKLL